MATYDEVLQLVHSEDPFEARRKKYICDLSSYTGRNTIIYYSAWLQHPNVFGDFSITDLDKSGFMTCMYNKNERQKGLDLILHTPGGEVGATESIIDYLRNEYGTNIRAIVPQLAMSGGTLIATAANPIVMGAHSSLGPVDPQYGGIAAQSYLTEFNRACEDVANNPRRLPVWQQVIGKIPPGFLEECINAVALSSEQLTNNLCSNMFKELLEPAKSMLIRKLQKLLVDRQLSKLHSRHIDRSKAREAGLNIVNLEDDQGLQNLVLTLHHLLCITFEKTPTAKIIASGARGGTSYIRTLDLPTKV